MIEGNRTGEKELEAEKKSEFGVFGIIWFYIEGWVFFFFFWFFLIREMLQSFHRGAHCDLCYVALSIKGKNTLVLLTCGARWSSPVLWTSGLPLSICNPGKELWLLLLLFLV